MQRGESEGKRTNKTGTTCFAHLFIADEDLCGKVPIGLCSLRPESLSWSSIYCFVGKLLANSIPSRGQTHSIIRQTKYITDTVKQHSQPATVPPTVL